MWVKSEFTNSLFTHIAGGYREVEIPSPIPNLEVKHFIADNTAGSPCGNVSRCQLLSIVSQKDYLFKAQFYSYKLLLIYTLIRVSLGRSFFFSPSFTFAFLTSIYLFTINNERSWYYNFFVHNKDAISKCKIKLIRRMNVSINITRYNL